MSINFQPGLVSVITPTFNRADFLLEAMDSVFNQTYRPIELIVVDDGSTDHTRSIIDIFRCKIANDTNFTFRYFYQKNSGAQVARNTGLTRSCGEFIQFLDSDDLLHPKRFERIIPLFDQCDCEYVITGFDGFCDRCGQIIENHIPECSGDALVLFCQDKLWGSILQFTWKRDLIDQIGYWDTKLVVYQDYDYIIRTLLISQKGIPVKDILSHARRGGSLRISDIRLSKKGYESFLRSTSKLCDGILSKNISQADRKALASKLFRKAVLIYYEFPDIAYLLGRLGQSIDHGPYSFIEFVERFSWRFGRLTSTIYFISFRIYFRLIRFFNKNNIKYHSCQ